MIIKSEWDTPVVHDQPFDRHGPLAQLAQVSAEFTAFLAVHHEIRNKDVYNLL
jgi:hypothetical protein